MVGRTPILLAALTLAMLGSATRGSAAEEPAPTAGPLQEVQVTAHRLELEKRVARFVDQIAATENSGEGLARWEVPAVCPLVSGLQQPDGEVILERLSEIAHVAGVPLADEHCHPNLYILITGQPEELLRGMEKRNRAYTFGYDRSFYPPAAMPTSVVDEFINTSRPVRVWYSSAEKDAWGKPLAYCQSQLVLPKCTESGFGSHAACDPNRYYRCGTATAGGSHLVFSSVWTFSRVFVIVDQKRLQGVSISQLADYVAMSGFAKLNPDAHLGDATSILTLFNAAPEAEPKTLTDWDRSFLKSLYSTEQTSRQQRSQIARTMVRDIIPDGRSAQPGTSQH